SSVLCGLALAVVLLAASPLSARAEGDGLYGRWDEDLVVSLGGGGGVSLGGDGAVPVGAAMTSVRYLGAAGPLVAATLGPDGRRPLVAGAELRPLLPGLFLMNLSTTLPFVDLLLQSIAIELGAAFLLDGAQSVGFGFGLGIEVPLVYPDVFAQGVTLRLGGRRVFASADDQGVDASPTGRWSVLAQLVFSFGVGSGIVSLAPSH